MSERPHSDPSDSVAQTEIERAMLDRLQKLRPNWRRVSWQSIAPELELPPVWQNIRPDGVWQTTDHETVVAECYARVGELKAGHRRKLAMDTLKLLSLQKAVEAPNRLHCLLVVPDELDQQLRADDWLSVTIRQVLEVVPVKLTDVERDTLQAAAERQAAGQARTKKARRG